MPTALSVETGQQSASANSYITQADYNTYINDRHIARAAAAPSADNQTIHIHSAMTYFESLEFIGSKATEDQALQFPRHNVVIDGYGYDSDEIPNQVKIALYEIAYAYEQGFGIDDPIGRETASETVGSLSVTYKNSSSDRTLTPAATNALRKLIKNPMTVVRV